MNHSPTPNCKMFKKSVDHLEIIIVEPIEDIQKGSELTFDYSYEPALEDRR